MTDQKQVTGADALCDTLLKNDIDVCFANPGTSEMHFVAALDKKPQMRCVLGLFEGVVTGAADGYARISGKPAATLLHLGSGLGNGLANLHNAKRARSPIVNIIGDHATFHSIYDAPLTSDIPAIAAPVSHWVKKTQEVENLVPDALEAIRIAQQRPGRIASLILPADIAWSALPGTPAIDRASEAAYPGESLRLSDVQEVATRLRSAGERSTLLLGADALHGDALLLAGAIARHTKARLLAETFSKRIERGSGRTVVPMLPYPIQQALDTLADVENLILIGARKPVAFFAYPDKPSELTQTDTVISALAGPEQDVLHALRLLAQELNVDVRGYTPAKLERPAEAEAIGSGKLSGGVVCSIVAASLPEGAIVVDEAISEGRMFPQLSQASAPHDYLQLTGGAIGIGIPLSTGAAVASQRHNRKVVTLQADGSGMYTLQGLWTQAREKLNCLTIIFANHNYASLHMEMKNVGVTELGENARNMLDLVNPTLSWAGLATSLGVEAKRVDNVADFKAVLQFALSTDGPFLIEAVV
ncbi:acetolactate synthase large subunit [Alcaligenaceae bacterium]|nr:acetolactate synthase large subunit [Alcaligenaceae bacterium]